MNLEEIEKKLGDNLEKSLKDWDYKTAKVDMEYYDTHIQIYSSKDIERYCNLKNKFMRMFDCLAE